MRNLIFVISLLVIFVFSCGKKEEKKVEAPKETPKVETPAETKKEEAKLTKTFTDDDFIEYWAQLTYITDKYAENPNPTQWAQDIRKIYDKFGISETEEDAFQEKYNEWLENWGKMAATDPEKWGKEWEALMKKYEKRVAELKAGK